MAEWETINILAAFLGRYKLNSFGGIIHGQIVARNVAAVDAGRADRRSDADLADVEQVKAERDFRSRID